MVNGLRPSPDPHLVGGVAHMKPDGGRRDFHDLADIDVCLSVGGPLQALDLAPGQPDLLGLRRDTEIIVCGEHLEG